MKKNQNGFGIVEGLLILVVIGLIGSVAIVRLHSKKSSDSQKKATIDSTINEILTSATKDNGLETRQEKGCYQTNQGPYNKGDAACRQVLDLLYNATSTNALVLLTGKQKFVESKLVNLGYIKDYETITKPRSTGTFSNDYGSSYNHKTGVNCKVITSFPANAPEISSAYPKTFQNLANIRLECSALVGSYFYSTY